MVTRKFKINRRDVMPGGGGYRAPANGEMPRGKSFYQVALTDVKHRQGPKKIVNIFRAGWGQDEKTGHEKNAKGALSMGGGKRSLQGHLDHEENR